MRIISGKHRGTKLYTLEGENTRPTLDRVKEPLFSIINFLLPESVVLDLFAGSGALGLESISRGASKAILCDNSREAIHIIGKNVEKVHEELSVEILNINYLSALEKLKNQNQNIDIVFLDPPYETEFIKNACEKIVDYNLLNVDGRIIAETDRENEVESKLSKIEKLQIYDKRKYGRVCLFFLKYKDE